RSEDARPDGTHRAVHRRGDLLVGETLELAEHDSRAQILRESFYRGIHRRANLIRQHEPFGGLGIFHTALHVVRLICVVAVEVIFDWTAVPGNDGVLCGVDRYTVQPSV